MAQSDTGIVRRARHADAPVVARGEGIYIWDTEGRRYIDGASGSSVVVNIGHGVASVAEAMYRQAGKIAFAATHVFTSEPVIQLGDMLAERMPGEMLGHSRIWLSNTGTDAVDDAARLARQYWVARGEGSKYLIISRWQGFHGNNLAVAGLSGHTLRRRLYYPMFVDTPHIPAAYCYRCPFELAQPECKLKCARSLETMIHQVGAENVAAFIAEPVVGAALGAVAAPDGYFQIIRETCDRHNILFIADEVMTAWGRAGYWFAIDRWGVTPDIIATAKGISSGYTPLAATIAREEIWRAIDESGASFMAGHTMNQNPLSCAVAVANLQYMETHDIVGNARSTGAYLGEQLQTLRDIQMVGDARGLGMMYGLEFVRDQATKEPFDPALKASWVVEQECLRRGLVLYACTGCVEGVAGDMMLVTPPLVITRPQVDELVGILREALVAAQKRLM